MMRFWKEFAQGDIWVKGSCLVMGLGCLKRGQIVKGLAYLAAEILFFLFFFGFGSKYLSHFLTLGENAQLRIWNEEMQIYQRVPGDNSMLILLFSVLTIAVTLLFLCLWVMNLKTASRLYQLEKTYPVPPGRWGNAAE
ncbi:MAG: hypothetical protein IJ189_07095 [Clostridia bacterium]|nr:hypothetical protein [Clostridia bacterium]